jgi:hypothetical protein
MNHSKHTTTRGPRTFVYRGTLPAGLVLLLLAPILFLSLAAAVVAGGMLAAFVLPLFLRRSGRRVEDDQSITLRPDQYSRVDAGRRQVPPQ